MQEQYDCDVTREQWEQEQDALPPHKRDGYAEMMAEMTDERLKAIRENGL